MNGYGNDRGGEGRLRIQATTADGALPVKGALVRISRAAEAGFPDVSLYTFETDESGLTPIVILEAPPKGESLAPGAEDVYAVYRVTVSREGFYPVEIGRVPVFDGVGALQPIALIPVSEGGAFSPAGEEEHLGLFSVPADTGRLAGGGQ